MGDWLKIDAVQVIPKHHISYYILLSRDNHRYRDIIVHTAADG